MKNQFLKAAAQTVTLTENGSKAYESTGSHLIDQFATAGTHRGRDYDVVSTEQSLIWDENAELAVRFPFYVRMITRKVKINNDNCTDKAQSGLGARDESFKRLLWMAEKHNNSFNQNIWLLPIVGSWKDLWVLMFMDKTMNLNVINHKIFFGLMAEGLKIDAQLDLIKKFMPRIKSAKKCTTEWTRSINAFAKEFANFMGWTYAEYNKFKATGTAHDFQKLMCSKKFSELEWNKIPGRALSIMTKGRFLPNHNLADSYSSWLDAQPTAKFTGYVYELGSKVKTAYQSYQKITINKQFLELIKKGKEVNGGVHENVFVCCDESASMTWTEVAPGITPYIVCNSLGIYFAELNEGAFHKHVMQFSTRSRLQQLTGDFCDMWSQITRGGGYGSTNFNSVIDEIIRIRNTRPEIPLEDYPTTILVVSDMQFDGRSQESNYEYCKRRLAEVFPEDWCNKVKFIWWFCTDRTVTFPTTMDDGGTYFFGGFDGSIISTLLGGEGFKDKTGKVVEKPSMEEVVNAALSQEILLNVKL